MKGTLSSVTAKAEPSHRLALIPIVESAMQIAPVAVGQRVSSYKNHGVQCQKNRAATKEAGRRQSSTLRCRVFTPGSRAPWQPNRNQCPRPSGTFAAAGRVVRLKWRATKEDAMEAACLRGGKRGESFGRNARLLRVLSRPGGCKAPGKQL